MRVGDGLFPFTHLELTPGINSWNTHLELTPGIKTTFCHVVCSMVETVGTTFKGYINSRDARFEYNN